MPRGGDLSQYGAKRDWGTQGDARRAMYDLSRDTGMSHTGAVRASELGAAKLAADLGDGPAIRTGGTTRGIGAAHTDPARRSPFRTPFPWETQAGTPRQHTE